MTNTANTPQNRDHKMGLKVVAGFFVLSLVMTAFFLKVYIGSEKGLRDMENDIASRSAQLNLEQCVDETIAFRKKCDVMEFLCGESVSRMAAVCLKARPHKEECEALVDSMQNSKFGFKECQDRGFQKRSDPLMKACGQAYSEIRTYCSFLLAGKI